MICGKMKKIKEHAIAIIVADICEKGTRPIPSIKIM
jgi:hypothetical protein